MTSVKKILVPVDFSSISLPVLRYALSIAKTPDAEITILYVNELTSLPFGSSSYPFGVVTFPELEKEINDWALEETGKLLNNFSKEAQSRIQFKLESGKSADVIARTSVLNGFDLVVMAAHTHGVVEKFFLGSTMERLLRITQVPVIVMRDPESVPPFPPKHVMISSDFSEESFQVFPIVKRLVSGFSVRVSVLSVDSLESGFLAKPNPAVIDKWNHLFIEAGITIGWNQFRATDPVEGVLAFIQDEQPDLIAITTHGRSGLNKILLGSTTESIIRQIHLPVLVHHLNH